MANSIFKEITFTPNVFDKEIALENERKFEKLLNALEDITDSGIIIGITRQWKSKIDSFIEKYDDSDKTEIHEIFKQLMDRNRFATYPISKEISDEEDWIKQANQIAKVRAFDAIVASMDGNTTKQIDHYERKFFKNKGALVNKQTKSLMNKMLSSILGYAEIVKIIDPYFSLEEERYTIALEVICKNLANHHGVKDEAVIEIHISVGSEKKDFYWKQYDKWPSIIKDFEKKYKHTIKFVVWEERKDGKGHDRWHDRWIITDQCGISIGKGSDIGEWTDSTWSLLDWEELPNIESKFKENRNIYNNISTITSRGVIKKKNPRNIKMTREEREKDLFIKKQYLKSVEKKEEEQKNKKTEITKSGFRKKV